MLRVEELGGFYRIISDSRDLNYHKFFDVGDEIISETNDYTSENTKRLNIDEVTEMLLSLNYIKNILK